MLHFMTSYENYIQPLTSVIHNENNPNFYPRHIPIIILTCPYRSEVNVISRTVHHGGCTV